MAAVRATRRASLIGACFALGLAAGPVAVYAGNPVKPGDLATIASQGSTGSAHAAALWACVDGQKAAMNAGKTEECIATALEQALDQDAVPALYDTLEALYDQYPTVRGGCHSGAHQAGIEWYQSGKVPAESFAEEAAFPSRIADGCLYGITHGFYDYLALHQDSIGDWDALVHSCERAREDGSNRTFDFHGCTEGLGHLAWHITLDGVEGPRKCLAFQDPGPQAFCALSVFMEAFAPRPDVMIAKPSRLYSNAEWVTLCRQLGQEDADLGIGCAGGASYARTRNEPILSVYEQVSREQGGTAEEVAKVIDLVDDAISFCGIFTELGEKHVEYCLISYLTSLPRASIGQESVLSRFCGPDGRLPPTLCEGLRSQE